MKTTTGDTMDIKIDPDGYLTKCPRCGLGRGHVELQCSRCGTQLLPGFQPDTPQRYECVDCCGSVFKTDEGIYKCGWCRRVHTEDELLATMEETDDGCSISVDPEST